MAGRKHFDFFELARQENGRFLYKEDNIDNFTVISGLAARGTLDSQPAWLLKKEIIVGGAVICVEYADDAQFTQIWDNRTTVFTIPDGSSGTTNYFPPVRLFDHLGQPFDGTNTFPVTGSFTPSGLTTALLVTNTTVGNTAAKLPLSPLTDRNSLIIENRDALNSIFIGNADVTAAGATQGWEIQPASYYALDITDSIEIYAVASVASVSVKVLELA